MMAGIVAVDAFCCIPFAYLRYKGKAWRFAGIKLLSIFLNIILNIFFLITCPWLHTHYPEAISWFYRPDYGVGYVFVANVFTTLITLLLLIPDILPGIRAKVDGTVLRQILRYSFPILILGIAGIFNQTADKILFPFLFDDKEFANEQLGIYGACFKIAVVMVMFTQAFRYAYEPFIFAKNKSDDNKKAYSEAMKYFIIFALFIFLGVMFYIDILKYFVGPAYYPGLRVVPIVMLGELFFGIYFNLSLWYKPVSYTHLITGDSAVFLVDYLINASQISKCIDLTDRIRYCLEMHDRLLLIKQGSFIYILLGIKHSYTVINPPQ